MTRFGFWVDAFGDIARTKYPPQFPSPIVHSAPQKSHKRIVLPLVLGPYQAPTVNPENRHHRATSRYIALHHTTWQHHRATSRYIALHCTTSRYIALHGTTSHYIALHRTTTHYIALHCGTSRSITLHGGTIVLHRATLR